MSRIEELLSQHHSPDRNVLNVDTAATLLRENKLPPNSVVDGYLEVHSNDTLRIPPGLFVDTLVLNNQVVIFSPGFKARSVILYKVKLYAGLPNDLECDQLVAEETHLREVPDGIVVRERLDLSRCLNLKRLPENLKTGALVLSGCAALETLPEGLSLYFLNISDCRKIRTLPRRGALNYGRLVASRCVNLESLPDWLEHLTALDLQNCARIKRLPEHLKLSGWLDIGGTQITSLPPHMDHVEMRWRGVPISHRVAFRPETLTSDDILQASNAEERRVMLERVGFERFVELARAETLDTDTDQGGERRLLKVAMPSDEDLVCVSFSCPSTGRKYVVRVPPKTRTARAAVAWIAGFDNPDDYRPDLES